ncbi:MAG: tetratricopeptide repeat protein [Candidatus Marinimicrobia bacterium]|jgi:predicted negative regulator of RcsB-dependent stress response|nr:tetratricopeptide repeat protein [Candidatus Neomarinimicrobiota bacterium]
MLRPKKKITRKEIQRDPFLETVDQAQAHLEENRSKYLQLGIVLLILLLGYNITTNRKSQRDIDASASLGDALLTLDNDDLTTAQFQFETVLNEFDNTPSASVAGYYLGKINYNAGNMEEAGRYLNSYIKVSPKGFLAPSATIMLADISANDDQLKEAIQILNKGIRNVNSKKDLRLLRLRKAELELRQGNKDIAKSIVEELLLEDGITNWNKQRAQEIVGRIVS